MKSPTPSTRRPRLLFQYKPYCQQDPLNLAEAEVAAVIDAVFGPMEGGAGPASVLQVGWEWTVGVGGGVWADRGRRGAGVGAAGYGGWSAGSTWMGGCIDGWVGGCVDGWV